MLILNNDPEGLSTAIKLINSGEVILWPSGGVYDMACNAHNESAVNYIYSLKSREKGKALPVLTNRIKVHDYGVIDRTANNLIDKYWPGFLAIIAPKQPLIPDFVTAGKTTVALVCPNDLAAKLVSLSEVPIAVTSANISGESEVLEIQEAINLFDGKIKAIIKSDKMPGTLTTILDITQSPPKVLREGGIPKDKIFQDLS